MMMVFSRSSRLLCLLALLGTAVASHSHSHLRVLENDDGSPCNAVTTEQQCYETVDDTSQQPCVWCRCQAIPSECLSPAQSQQVPAGVFDCSSPSVSSSNFLEGIRLTSRAVDEDLCDAKGSSGYLVHDCGGQQVRREWRR